MTDYKALSGALLFVLATLFVVGAWNAALVAGVVTVYQISSLVAGSLLFVFSGAVLNEVVKEQ